MDAPARFDQEVKAATRTTGISAGAIAALAYPVWTAFDYLVAPETAGELVWLRVGFTIPIALLWLGLVLLPQGRTHPELFVLGLIFAVNLGIAMMIARIESHYSAYALGMSLTIYASAFLLIWSPRYMAGVIALNLGSFLGVLALSDPVATDAIATVLFYLGTASLVSFVGQLHRHRVARGEFESRVALEREQALTRELVRELDRQSREDALTGLANRRAWDEELARQGARSARDRSPFCVLICDLDGLKGVNDNLGHPVGDLVLKTTGRALAANVRGGDVVARLGGDEFAVLMPGADALAGAELANRLRHVVREESLSVAPTGGVTLSVGVAEWEPGDDTPDAIMLRADRRLYRAKATRDVVCAGDPGRVR